jgi:hypothetical protein
MYEVVLKLNVTYVYTLCAKNNANAMVVTTPSINIICASSPATSPKYDNNSSLKEATTGQSLHMKKNNLSG